MDLTTEQGMQLYLREKLYPSCSHVRRLPEGFGGFVYRVQTNDTKGPPSIVVKHVESYAARSTSWKLEQRRMVYEHKALEYLSSLRLPVAGIRAPQVFHFDSVAWVLVIEDAGECPSLKGWLQPGADLDEAEAMGSAIGNFLATVHDASAGEDALLRDFGGNETAKHLSGTLYFRNLPAIAEKWSYTGEHIKEAARRGEQDVRGASEVLTLGDFWTGNVLVAEDRELFVVDLELSKPGTPDFDIGQMAAEMYCVAAYRSPMVGNKILNAFLTAYRSTRTGAFDVAKVAIRIGVHLFVIMPNAWSGEASQEQIAEQIKVADELIRIGVERDMDGLRDPGGIRYVETPAEKNGFSKFQI